MEKIKLAAAALNQTPLAWDQNAANIRAAMQRARETDVSILCLPELCITGYGCEDAFHSTAVAKTAMEVLQELIPDTDRLIVSLGLPVMFQRSLYNCAALVADGQLLGLVGKQNLASDGLHYEPRWFRPWPNDAAAEITLGSQTVPLGDLIFECGGVRISFEICEDAWVLRRPGHELARQQVDVLLNPSASHFAFGKHEVRKQLVSDASQAFHAAYVYANLLGNEAGRIIYDGDTLVAANGQLLAVGPRLTFGDVELASAVVNLQIVRAHRSVAELEVSDVGGSAVVTSAFEFPSTVAEAEPTVPLAWEQSPHIKQEEFLRTICLGLFDYLRKSHAQGFVVSLSGGVDSAAVAVLAAFMSELAAKDLSIGEVVNKLRHIPALVSCRTPAEMTRELLTCVYQATRNSSQMTQAAAEALANALHARFYLLDIGPIVGKYTNIVETAVERRLDWETDDLTLQNIQARARGPSAWMLANLNSGLLLATSNRSEAAVGYATMDGDTCGGLSPIAGIDKAFLRRWLQWLETTGPQGLFSLPVLQLVNAQQPTAELRPPQAGQTDEADLMPYDVLDLVERAAIRDKLSPLECLRRLESLQLPQPRSQLAEWVEKFFVLWCRNQWKRERYAPSFHVDDENLDPKTWCRFPILSGGYTRELRQMWDYVIAPKPVAES